ncbi:hypothetical protein CISIN_1g023278mg [Citrus sinensis]|uniref:PIFI-like Ig-like domain-containing protein n=1 Tax=Citrus sinensis TaxID=2711 RepID=A0A067E039_CITSI|nr:hypothetical protein CISIN_1g023278mg [Citrus sinensis]
MAATAGSIFAASSQFASATRSVSCRNATPSVSSTLGSSFKGASLPRSSPKQKKTVRITGKVTAAVTTATNPYEEIEEYTRPSWAMFELGKAPVYWKTMNGLPPMSGEKLKIFYNPYAKKLLPNEDFGIGFNGGFNQPFMCGGEPRAMLRKNRGQNDSPFYTIQICVPKHAINLIFSFTNGVEWDGPYRIKFLVPRAWRNKPMDFFNKVITKQMSVTCNYIFTPKV